MRVIYLVYKWCWIISSDFNRQYAFGEHSPAIFLFIIAMHDKHLVHETATLSILDSNVDFESHALIDSPPHNHQHTTGTVPQHFQCEIGLVNKSRSFDARFGRPEADSLK